MKKLQGSIDEYRKHLESGTIQQAYRGIFGFLSEFRSHMINDHPDYVASALYPGYMDMSYFAFTPPQLKESKLKVAIVYLHEEGRFEAWLVGVNRKIQALWLERFNHQDIGDYRLSNPGPGVDSIIETILVSNPNFNDPETLMKQMEEHVMVFIKEMTALMSV